MAITKRIFLLLLASITRGVHAFHLQPSVLPLSPSPHVRRTRRRRRTSSSLYSIQDWRDTPTHVSQTTSSSSSSFNRTTTAIPPSSSSSSSSTTTSLTHEINILTIPLSQIILQGETTQIHVSQTENPHLGDVFRDCIDHHGSVLALGILLRTTPNDQKNNNNKNNKMVGLYDIMPLCEIESTILLQPDEAVFTIRVVSRARLLSLLPSSNNNNNNNNNSLGGGVCHHYHYKRGLCIELFDNHHPPPPLQWCDITSGNIENLLVTLSALEFRLREKIRGDRLIRRRLMMNDYDEEGEEEGLEDRTLRFRRAYESAKNFDVQGYYMVLESEEKEERKREYERSLQDLTAVSWAAFCSGQKEDEDEEEEDERTSVNGYRLEALGCLDVYERLQLADMMLRETREELNEVLDMVDVDRDDDFGDKF